jgi:hypothetical protein
MHGYRQKKILWVFVSKQSLSCVSYGRSKPAMMRRKPGDRRATWLTWWCRPVTGTRLIAFRESRGRGAHQVASQAIPIQTLNNGASRPRSRRRLALTRPTRTRRRALSSSVFFPPPSTYEPAPLAPTPSSPSMHPLLTSPRLEAHLVLKHTSSHTQARAHCATPIPATSQQQQAATVGKGERRWGDPWTRRHHHRCTRRR